MSFVKSGSTNPSINLVYNRPIKKKSHKKHSSKHHHKKHSSKHKPKKPIEIQPHHYTPPKSHCTSSSSSSSSSSSDCEDECFPTMEPFAGYSASCTPPKVTEFDHVLANDVTARTGAFQPRVVMVPSADACTLGEALDRIQDGDKAPFGYRIILKNGDHTLARSHNSDVSNLRIEAQSFTPHMGVGYFNGVGQSEFLRFFDVQHDKVAGLGPWSVTTCGKTVSVCGEGADPDFTMLNTGPETNEDGEDIYDSIMFYTMCNGEDSFIKYNICGADGNTLYLDRQVCLPGDQPNLGEGFYVNPRARVHVAGHQKVVVQGRMEWAGIEFANAKCEDCQYECKHNCHKCAEMVGPFVTGATAGTNEISHSLVGNSMFPVGCFEWYYPNTWRGQFSNIAGFGGNAYYQSMVGKSSMASFGGTQASAWNGSAFINNTRGITLTNGATLSTSFSNWVNCQTGVHIRSGSKHGIGGSIFVGCDKALDADQSVHIYSEAVPGIDSDNLMPVFTCNREAIRVNSNTHVSVKGIVMDNNTTDLTIDNEAIPNLSDYTSGEYKPRFSAMFYDSVISP